MNAVSVVAVVMETVLEREFDVDYDDDHDHDDVTAIDITAIYLSPLALSPTPLAEPFLSPMNVDDFPHPYISPLTYPTTRALKTNDHHRYLESLRQHTRS